MLCSGQGSTLHRLRGTALRARSSHVPSPALRPATSGGSGHLSLTASLPLSSAPSGRPLAACQPASPRKMNAGPQEASISVFLQFIEEQGCWAYGALSQVRHPREQLHNEMNLLYRKSKVEWKQSKDEEPKKG